MRPIDWLTQVLEVVAALAVAPLFQGWVSQCRAWLQNRRAPPLWQSYRGIRKLFHKDAVIATNASPLFRVAPYVVFATMLAAAAVIPSMGTRLPFSPAADAIALVGLFATARMFLALAAMDVGTPFGTLGARREMMVGFLAEPALLMVIFVAALTSSTTALPAIAERLATGPITLSPSLAFTGVAFTMVLLAENGRLPIDNPSTHLELTMIHESMILESAGRDLAWLEVGSWLRLTALLGLVVNLALPWGLTSTGQPLALLVAVVTLAVKLLVAGGLVAAAEVFMAKLRLFKVPELLAGSFVLAFLAVTASYLAG